MITRRDALPGLLGFAAAAPSDVFSGKSAAGSPHLPNHKELSSGRMSELIDGETTTPERERVTLLYRALQDLLKERGEPFLTALRLDVNSQ